MVRLLSAYAPGRLWRSLYVLALATFPKGNPNAEAWGCAHVWLQCIEPEGDL
jgi:hypothetical protein